MRELTDRRMHFGNTPLQPSHVLLHAAYVSTQLVEAFAAHSLVDTRLVRRA
jgi:hypothetical protein